MPAKFVGVALLSGFTYLLTVSHFETVAAGRAGIILFWAVAVTLRLIALPLTPGDDLWRYQWEGKVQRAGFNPYVTSPDNERLQPLRAEFPEWHKINHRHFRTIYPPGAQLVFAGMSAVSQHPLFYKSVFALADMATIALLLRLIAASHGAGAPPRPGAGAPPRRDVLFETVQPARGRAGSISAPVYAAAAWYAWNPLIAYSFTGAAHFDSLMLLPMVAAILFLVRAESEQDSRRKWWFALASAIALGLAISIKLIPILLILLFGFALRKRAVVLIAALLVPLLLSLLYGFPQIKIWQSLSDFAYVTRLNDLFWWAIEDTVWPNPRQKNYRYNVILLVAVALVSLVFIRNWKRGLVWVLGTALILSPALHAWYCTWILPVATWRRSYAWHVLSVSIFAYYLFWNERLFTLAWRAEPWQRGMIILPPLLAFLSIALTKNVPPKHDAVISNSR